MYRGIIKGHILAVLITSGIIACTPMSQTNQPQVIVYRQNNLSMWWPFQRNDLWAQFRRDSKITDASAIPQVRKEINALVRNKATLTRAIQKGSPYMYHIYQETQKQQLPVELTLLPIMESDYNPFAYSRRGAAGLWQLMPAVAQDFNIKNNWWYDGRRDVVTSTNAALRHFSTSYNYFNGDLLLALASYDAGRNRVTNAMKQNAQLGLSTDFWSLPLPRETRDYVPRLLALATIINNPEKYGIQLPPIKYEPYLTQIQLNSQVDLAKIAKLANMNIKYLYALNPGFNRWVTDPNGPHKLTLPIENAEIFQRNFNILPNGMVALLPDTQPKMPKYAQQHMARIIKANVKLARQQGTTVRKMMITKNNVIRITNRNSIGVITNKPISSLTQSNGRRTRISVSNRSIINKSQHRRVNAAPVIKKSSSLIHYRVSSGDSLSTIAKRYKVKVASLRNWNNLKNNGAIRAGQMLVIHLV